MPRLPTYRDVNQTGLQNTQRVLQGPTPVGNVPIVRDNTGEGMARFGSAIVEITDRIRESQIENEVRKADIKTQVALQKFKDNLSTIDDENEYERQWNEGAQKILNEAGNKLSSPMGQRLWKARSSEHFGKGLMDVRDMARRKGVDKTKAGVIELASMADQLQDDPTATDALRKEAADSAISAMENLARRGFVSHEEATRFKVGMQDRILKKTQERTQLAMAQGLEDGIWEKSAGDYGAASEMVRGIEDPVMRDLVQNRIDDRYANEDRIRNAEEEQASQEVAVIFTQGGRLSDVPKDALAKLKPSTLLSLKAAERSELNAARNDAKQAAKEMSAVFKGALEAQSYEDPTTFAKDGFLEKVLESGKVTVEDASSLLVRRAQIRAGKGSDPLPTQIYKDAKEIAAPLLGKYGLDLSPKANDTAGQNRKAAFENALLREAQAFAQREKRAPNPKETQEIIARVIIKADRTILNGTSLKASDGKNIKATTGATIPYEAIPQADRDAVLRSLQRKMPGKVITNIDVRNEYARLLAGKN